MSEHSVDRAKKAIIGLEPAAVRAALEELELERLLSSPEVQKKLLKACVEAQYALSQVSNVGDSYTRGVINSAQLVVDGVLKPFPENAKKR